VEKFIDTPVKRYSSGMSVRLAFAVAAHLEPEILLVDEVLAVGDAEFQRRCLGRMEDISLTGRTVLFVSHNMQTLTALCNRAIWLDQGKILLDGKSSEVVAQYLQAGFGTGSQREWPDVETAPGNQYVRMRFVRVVQDGEVTDAVDVRRPVGIEIGFRVMQPGPALFPKVKLWDSQSNVAFNAMDTHPRWDDSSQPGDYVTTAWIPGNLLNEGLMTALVQICSFDVMKMLPHAGSGNVAFHVQDPGEGDSARGRYTGQWKGVVRRSSSGRPRSVERLTSGQRVACRRVELVERAREPVAAVGQRRERGRRRVRGRCEHARLAGREAAAVEARRVAEKECPSGPGERLNRLVGDALLELVLRWVVLAERPPGPGVAVATPRALPAAYWKGPVCSSTSTR
jgi:hypothetical protein